MIVYMPFSLKLRYMRPRACRHSLKLKLGAPADSADRRGVKRMNDDYEVEFGDDDDDDDEDV